MRAAVFDLPSQPIRNHALVPRATSAGSTLGIRPNSDRWGAYVTYSLVTGAADGPIGITTYIRQTVTTARAGLGFHLPMNTEVNPVLTRGSLLVSSGEVVTISAYFRTSVDSQHGIGVRAFNSGTGLWIAGLSGGGYINTAAGVWLRIAHTYSIPVGSTDLAAITLNGPSLPVGATLDMTGLMVTKTPGVVGFKDGDSPGGRWIGTAHLSESIVYPRA